MKGGYSNGMAKKDKIWTPKVLDILYECWKDAESEKVLAFCLEEKLPKIHPIAALSKIRKLSKTEKKWMQMATRKKNQKEKSKLDKIKAKEEKIKIREEKRKQRDEKKKYREKKFSEKMIREEVRKKFDRSYVEEITPHIDSVFFFCSDVQQYVPTIACIYRVFGSEIFPYCAECIKCKHMEKYLPIIKELQHDRESIAKQDEAGRHKTSSGSKGKTKRTSS